MTIRENLERMERNFLSPYAAFSENPLAEIIRNLSAIFGRYFKETGTESYIVRLSAD